MSAAILAKWFNVNSAVFLFHQGGVFFQRTPRKRDARSADDDDDEEDAPAAALPRPILSACAVEKHTAPERISSARRN